MPGGVSCFWKVKRTLGVAEEGGPSASAIFFFSGNIIKMEVRKAL